MSARNPFPGLRPFEFEEQELFFGREEQYEQMIGKLSENRFLAVVGTSGSGKSSLVKAGLLPALYGGMMSAGPNWRVALFRPKEDPIQELALALNHRRVFGDRSKENGSSLFKMSEVIDWPNLCRQLSDEAKEQSSSPSGRLLEMLPREKREAILNFARGATVDERKSDVVQTFNHVLKNRNLYEARDFERVNINGDAKALLSKGQKNLSNSEIERLNRLILEAAYPDEIAKNEEIRTQCTEVALSRGDLGLVQVAREANMQAGENLLVVVDQFEELFRYARMSEMSPHGNQAAAFVKLLLAAKSQREIPIYVVLTMRSDYLGDCAAFWDLPEAINEGQYLIPRLTRAQRREAIKGPIHVQGADITPQLVNQLLNDMGDNPDQLPILQHALMRTWDNWEKEGQLDQPLDIRHYDVIGRMDEALSRHADEAFTDLQTKRNEEIAEKLFKCLTEKGSGNRETRRPTELKDICDATGATIEEVIGVIDVFRHEDRSFLMPPPKKPLDLETSVDISHESLIRNWTKLKEWVTQEARSAGTYRRLVETARLHGEGEAGLLTALEVDYAMKWLRREEPNVFWASRYHCDLEIVSQCHGEPISAKPRQERDEEIFQGAMAFLEKSRRECKKQIQIRRFATVLVAASVVLMVAFTWAVWQWMSITRENRLKARLAYGAKMNLTQRELEAENFAEVNRLLQNPTSPEEQSALLNRFAWHRWFLSPQDAMLDESLYGFERNHVWLLSHDELKTVGEYPSRILSVSSPKNSNLVATATSSGTLEVRDLSKGVLATLKEDAKDISTVAFAPDGTRVAIGRRDGTIQLWDLSDDLSRTTIRRELASPQGGGLPPVKSIAFSPNSHFVAFGTQEGTVRVWQTSDIKELNPVRPTSREPVSSVAFSSDNEWLAIAQKGIVSLIDVKTWEPIKLKVDSATAMLNDPNMSTEPPPINCMAFSADRKILAMGRSDSTILLWDLTENKYLVPLLGHSMEVLAVAFSERGTLASGSRDGGIRLWEVSRFEDSDYRKTVLENNASIEKKLKTFIEQKAKPVSRAKLKPDEPINPSNLRRRAGRKISRELHIRTLNGHAGAVTSLAFLPDQQNLVSGSEDRTVKLWAVNAKSSNASVKLGQPSKGGVSSLAFSPNGSILVTGNYDGSALLWNMREKLSAGSPGQKILEPGSQAVSAVAFSPDGGLLATASWDKTVMLWQMNNLKTAPRLLSGHSGPVLSVIFLDSKELVTGSADKTVRLWDVNTGSSSIVTKLEKGEAVLSLAYSPESRILAIGTTENTVLLWDLRRRKQLPTLEGHTDAVASMVFSPDGRTLATGSVDTTAKLWDPQTATLLATLHGHSKRVLCLSFSPDSARLTTGSEDGSVKLWDTSYEPGEESTRHALMTLKDVRLGPAFAVAFSPDGQILATGNGDGTVLLRYAATKELIARQSQPRR